MKILLASNNKFKTEESKRIIRAIEPLIEVFTPSDLGINIDPEESGNSYLENAKIKAEALRAELERLNIEDNYIIISDDCGVEVKALNGGPGIYSHRYLNGSKGMEKLLNDMMPFLDKEERAAKYCGGMYMIRTNKNGCTEALYTETFTPGYILFNESGTNGFSYDFVFAPEEVNLNKNFYSYITFGSMSGVEKDKISFRGKNLRAIIGYCSINN